ncbi:MAG: hypothetical protein L0Z62_19295 [Gemmataceae bacterium]|nr:hypothetical protein [Gemmataceae bacterium]
MAKPVPSLGGARHRDKPVIPLEVIGPAGRAAPGAIVDSAADDVVFPFALAAQLGIDLSQAPPLHAPGVGSTQPSDLLYASVILELSDGKDSARWRAVVAFTKAHLRLPLFGVAGGIEHFRTILDVPKREVILDPHPTLPSTQDPVP